jgi:hypothetical protein
MERTGRMPDYVADAIDALVKEDGPVAGPSTPAAPAAADPPASAPAQEPAAESAPAPESAPSAEGSTPDAETLDIEALAGKLTPEQFKALLAKRDPDELVRLDERLNGKIGALAQKQAREALERDAAQQRAADRYRERQQALANRDPDQALQVLGQQTAEEQDQAGRTAFDRAAQTFEKLLAIEHIAPLVDHLRGKDYAEEAGRASPGIPPHTLGLMASGLFELDMVKLVHQLPDAFAALEKSVRAKADAEWQERLKSEITPAIETRVRAEVHGGTPPAITGSSTAPAGPSDAEWLAAFNRKETNDIHKAAALIGLRL